MTRKDKQTPLTIPDKPDVNVEVDLHPDFATDRRTFMSIMGASIAMASAGLSGCIRKPREHIVPFHRRPEDMVPGNPVQFATSLYMGGGVLGLLVESQEGRPTKIEGNPNHPMSNPNRLAHFGMTHGWAQASVLDLYDPDRSQRVRRKGRKTTWKAFDTFAQGHFAKLQAGGGDGLAVLVEATPSPTQWELLSALGEGGAMAKARVYVDDPAHSAQAFAGLKLAGVTGARPVYSLDRARVVLAVDSDLLGQEGDVVRNARLFSEGRLGVTHASSQGRARARMNRLYVVEPHFTATGSMADNRLRLAPSLIGGFLVAVVAALRQSGLVLELPEVKPDRIGAWVAAAKAAGVKKPKAWVTEVARDLLAHRQKAVVAVGARQPAWVHGLAQGINAALGSVGENRPVALMADPLVERLLSTDGGLRELATSLRQGAVKTLVVIGGNPAYSAPVDLGLGELLGKVETSIHLSSHVDETSRRCTWHLPRCHYLETWGDLRAADGTNAIQQPLIQPLHNSRGDLELLGQVVGRKQSAHVLVNGYWKGQHAADAGFADRWSRWLHDGVADSVRRSVRTTDPDWAALGRAIPEALPQPKGLELLFTLDPSIYDGRFANNAWLQELPDTVSKLTWDNAVLLAPTTARRLGVRKGDLVRVSLGGRSVRIAAWIVPGVADNVLVMPRGYGRKYAGRVARKGRGFDVHPLRVAAAPHFVNGASLSKEGRSYKLATTQKHGSMVEPFTGRTRHVIRLDTLAHFQSPTFAKDFEKYELVKDHHNRSLWVEPNVRTGHQWGMVIDLGRCIGCNTCTLACQSENGIPVVGKKEILNGREMHWIRVDRYFTSKPGVDPESDADAGMALQPMPCQQCETAPCENVCPVGATVHSPEGLNDMAYNRCIGTRYCANNCPFKVRRFNFHGYAKRNDAQIPLLKMQRNPDVSVRFRGVMEKCTYCVQRIQEARIAAKLDPKRQGQVPEGAILPACVQACPAGAIVFGNLNDGQSKARKLRGSPTSYGLLTELNLHPRTTYLARVSNPNPRLA